MVEDILEITQKRAETQFRGLQGKQLDPVPQVQSPASVFYMEEYQIVTLGI